MTPFPTIRLEVEGMKYAILAAFTEQNAKTDEYVREALSKYCSPANLRQVVARNVEATIEEGVRDALRDFFKYGEGQKIIKDRILKEILNSGK
jgi:hypothetical protein